MGNISYNVVNLIFSFPATRGQSYSGDIAIDDLLFKGCGLPAQQKCKPLQFKCRRGSCTETKYQCDFNDDCGDSSDEENCGTFEFSSSKNYTSYAYPN